MVCTAIDLSTWKDFPKGLRVLLLDEDTSSATEIKSKLESMDYVVSTFSNENEALSVISSTQESFHVAILEASLCNKNGSFRFLEAAKDLPTIMTSNTHCLSTMMKCIALGAVEFLHKPLSEDKLKNIWQHVAHKAFNQKRNVIYPQFHEDDKVVNTDNLSVITEIEPEQSSGSDKFPAPSTPQLKQGGRSLDDEDCQDQTKKEIPEQEGNAKSVEITSENLVVEEVSRSQSSNEILIKEEVEINHGSENQHNLCSNQQSKNSHETSSSGAESPTKTSSSIPVSKASRKKMKVDWSQELHKKFVQAVEHLGIDQAIPSRILEHMKVEGLTRHNIASHLQKYRMQRRHILPKDEDWRWPQQKHQMQRSHCSYKPIMAFPTYHHPSNPVLPVGPVYHVWGTPNHRPPVTVPMGGNYPSWPYPGMRADAWGCPLMPPSLLSHYPPLLQNALGYYNEGLVANSYDPAEEIIDKVVKEAISKPWLPMPLGLKSPSTDCVLAELSKQGISTIPPNNINPSNSR